MNFIALILDWLIRALMLVVFVDVVLTYFMDPYHPIRRALDKIVNPMLNPIRRFLPRNSGIDFSPMILLLILILLRQLIYMVFKSV
jgi:YggT family protein